MRVTKTDVWSTHLSQLAEAPRMRIILILFEFPFFVFGLSRLVFVVFVVIFQLVRGLNRLLMA